MAGYGTHLVAPQWCDELIRVLLKAARRRARALHLEMHYRRRSASENRSIWELSVDGGGPAIAAWSRQLERDLPVVAEGHTGSVAPATARRIALSLVARWIAWAVGGVQDLRVRTSVGDPVRWVWPLIDYPEGQRLTARLLLADEIVARWLVEDIPEEIVIEELHTVVESVLRQQLSAKHRDKWPTLLDLASRRGLLTPAQKQLLSMFNRHYRNRLKHRGEVLDDSDRSTIRTMLSDVLFALDGLLDRPVEESEIE